MVLLLDQARPHPLPRYTAAQIIVAFLKACHMEAVGGDRVPVPVLSLRN
jgi:hypothetical protein